MARFRAPRPLIKQIERALILCEGETETYYFTGFIKAEKNRRKFSSTEVDIFKPKNHSPCGLIDEAKKRIIQAKKEKSPYKFVWVVFDKDGHDNIAKAFSDASEFNPPINIAFTATCFEYYILLHFIKTTHAYSKCDDLLKEVQKHLPNYQKASKQIFKTLENLLDNGLANSLWCYNQCQLDLQNGKMPYNLSAFSNIHELMNLLINMQ